MHKHRDQEWSRFRSTRNRPGLPEGTPGTALFIEQEEIEDMFHLLLTERSVESNWSLKDRVNIVIMGFHELCRIRGTLVRHNPTEEDQAAALEAERALDAAELAEMCGPESKREECLKRFWAFKKEIGKRDPETAPEEA